MAWTGRVFGLANLRFNCDGSVTYFSAFCRRRRKPAVCILWGGWFFVDEFYDHNWEIKLI
jgi:hypothetical protein